MGTWISAHRGGAALAPENTLASFRNGLQYHPDFLEMDIHLTKDGIPVVIHDSRIERTADGSGRVADYTLAELQTFNAAAKFAGGPYDRQFIPSLAQVLDLVKDTGVRLELEVKATADGLRYPAIEQKIIDELAQRDMVHRVRIMSFEFDTLVRAKRIAPCVQTVALLSLAFLGTLDTFDPERAMDYLQGFQINGIGVWKDLLTPALTDAAHKRNIMVGVWTVDDANELEKFKAMGVNSITTNRPDVADKVLKS